MWLIALLLYSLRLSLLIKIDYVFIVIVISFILLFILLNTIFIQKISLVLDIQNLNKSLLKNADIYKKIAFLFFCIGSIGFILEVFLYSNLIPVFMQNKINTGAPNHYIHYLTQFSMYSSLISCGLYILLKKRFFLLLIIISSIELLIWLKRGEILPLIFAIITFLFIKSIMFSKIKKFYIISLIFVFSFLLLFSYIGNLRMEYVLENIYHETFNERYQMPEWVPNSFGWIYIYIATTLENARHIIMEQDISSYTYGSKMIYPFLALFAKNIIHTNYYPELANNYGLTVVSFLGDAFNDFNILGVYIYTIVYFCIAIIGYKFINRGLFGVAVFVISQMFLIWSIFSNSISNGVYIIGFIIFILLSLKCERFKY